MRRHEDKRRKKREGRKGGRTNQERDDGTDAFRGTDESRER
jgi:hypothetical protein